MSDQPKTANYCLECKHVATASCERLGHTVGTLERTGNEEKNPSGSSEGSPLPAQVERLASPRTPECDRSTECEAQMHWSDCGTNPVNVEKRIEKAAIGGFINLHHIITGESCPRHLALGMATIAVSKLKRENDSAKAKIEALAAALKQSRTLIAMTKRINDITIFASELSLLRQARCCRETERRHKELVAASSPRTDLTIHELSLIREAVITCLDDGAEGEAMFAENRRRPWNFYAKDWRKDSDESNADRAAFCDSVANYLIDKLAPALKGKGNG